MNIDEIVEKYIDEANDNAKIAAADKKVSGLFSLKGKPKKPSQKDSEKEAPK
jgi:hypothetical protein